MMLSTIKVLCEQTREVNKRIKMFFGLWLLILFGLGNIVADFHVLFRVQEN